MTVQLTRTAAIVTAALLASACNKAPVAPTPASGAAPTAATTPVTAAPESSGPVISFGAAYQGVSIPGTGQNPGGFLRINVSTGQTVVGYNNQTSYVTVADTGLPAGQYHLYAWYQAPDSSGSVLWNVVRMETGSGRMWILNGGSGTTPYSWGEITVGPPQAAVPAAAAAAPAPAPTTTDTQTP
jgi:hypothetical protein